MKYRITCITLLCIVSFWAGIAVAQDSEKEKAAERAALDWLALVDSGEYENSWRTAAQYFKNAVAEDSWVKSLSAVRRPLGSVISRVVKSAAFHTALPGAPDGEYVVIQFESSFENKRSSIETVTPMLDKDGRWRVSGYYIQ